MLKMINVELVDNGGKMLCILAGDIVSMFVQYLCSNWTAKFVVGLQFVTLKYEDVQSIPNVTKLHINPVVEDQSVFNERFSGFEIEEPVEYLGYRDSEFNLQDDFIHLHPAKTLLQLIHTEQRGVFIVQARIVSVIKAAGWAYPSCRCYSELKVVNHGYSCSRCCRTMVKMMHRYRLNVHVSDGVQSSVFILSDPEATHIIKKACEEFAYASPQPLAAHFPPEVEEKLVGAEVLFKVRNDVRRLYDGCFCYDVLHICSDSETMDKFSAKRTSVTLVESKSDSRVTYLEEDNKQAVCVVEKVGLLDEDEMISNVKHNWNQVEG
ncbi:uncharacterized protein LOC130741223 isoform X2 [Lotus japonicus]|uniref:uncharacterized protein LOC130741223 isoform X2 n=1 Tax=Lotus japonicus TaxID=34305 RepID=UPI002587462C|nr:uncharacterized protein LOC130741223 isoform X2 [Lotus japonicus]